MDLVPRSRLWKTKSDILRPFRSSPSDAGEIIIPLYDPSTPSDEVQEPDLQELNAALAALVDIFPDVQPEVFREMLLSISEESRLQVVTEHLLQTKAKWVQGRYRAPSKLMSKERKRLSASSNVKAVGALDKEDLFRSDAYKSTVKHVFYQEFRNLSHSTIKAVLAEQNFSYTLARPVLQQLATKTWRFTLTNLWSKRSPASNAEGHPNVIWQPDGTTGESIAPAIRRTGNAELDQELFELFARPVITEQRQKRIFADFALASEVNGAEAEEAEALYDCECCYSSVPFERITACDGDCHFLCLDCIRRTVNEALYGQGWARTADLEHASVRCFSPTSQDCNGCLPGYLVRRALTRGSDNDDAWHDFQARITTETLLKCGLPLQRCPFCSYAEVNEPPQMKLKSPKAILGRILDTSSPFLFLLLGMAFTLAVPFLILVTAIWLTSQIVPPVRNLMRESVSRIYKQRRGIRFNCQNPGCMKASCTRCMAAWQDPHACFESEKTSLRTAIEASATAAVKRTCPKCMLSFVKSSGCNKLVCNCGYTMCYICRQEITSKEGYAHFCQHFRPTGGRCVECERCDLYGDEDEEAAIRRAAEDTEKAWRDKEGRKEGDEQATKLMIDALVGRRKNEWYEDYLDAVLNALIQ